MESYSTKLEAMDDHFTEIARLTVDECGETMAEA
jgi:hypothetical protein